MEGIKRLRFSQSSEPRSHLVSSWFVVDGQSGYAGWIRQGSSIYALEFLATFDLPFGDTLQWFSYGGAVELGMRY
jgi:hypothetical protein